MVFEGHFEYGFSSTFLIQSLTNNKILITSGESFINLDLGERSNITVRLVFDTNQGFLVVRSNSNVLSVSIQEKEPVSIQDFVRTNNLDVGLTVKGDGHIYISRNHFGTIPLYYFHRKDEIFAFSTQLSSLVKKSGVKRYLDIDKGTITKYCTRNYYSTTSYNSATFFKNIKSGLPGHILITNMSSVHNERYLMYDLSRFESFQSPNQYSQELRKVLGNSVALLTDDKPIATHLSGGLDSSTISALTKLKWPAKELITYYSTAETNLTPSIDYAGLVSQKIGSTHYKIPTKTNDLELLEYFTSELGFPTFSVSSLAKTHAILQHGKALGIKIMLTGHFGDEIIGKGFSYLKELFRASDWATLNSELEKRINDPGNNSLARNFSKLSTKKRLSLIKSHFFAYRFIELIEQRGVRSLPTIFNAGRYFELSLWYIFRRMSLTVVKRLAFLSEDRIVRKKREIEPVSESETVIISQPELTPAHQEYLNDIHSKNIVSLCEEYFAIGNLYGINIQFPFLNKEVIELCAATPEKYKYYIGSGRRHLRMAMDGLLPDQVLAREDKSYFSQYARESAKRLIIQSEGKLDQNSTVWEYFDFREYLKIKDALLNERKRSKYYAKGSFYVLKAISLHIWFNWVSEITKPGISD